MEARVDVQRLFEAVEAVGAADARRRTAFREEYADYSDGALDRFERTRAVIADERTRLDELDGLLVEEVRRLEGLEAAAEHLSVDQAVRNRDEALSKLRDHNEHLRTFHDEVSAGLDAIEANLDAVERAGPEAVERDPEPHLATARRAIQDHDGLIEGLGRNLRILEAYLL